MSVVEFRHVYTIQIGGLVYDNDSGEAESGEGELLNKYFQLTREEAAIAGIISSRTSVGIDETGRRRKITLSVTMQDPQVAAIVVDTILEHLKEYVTEYRTSKSRRMLEYTEKLRKEAQAEYYKAQENILDMPI